MKFKTALEWETHFLPPSLSVTTHFIIAPHNKRNAGVFAIRKLARTLLFGQRPYLPIHAML